MLFGFDSVERTTKEILKILGMIGNIVEENVDNNEIKNQNIIIVDDNDNRYAYEKDPDSPDDIEVFNIRRE